LCAVVLLCIYSMRPQQLTALTADGRVLHSIEYGSRRPFPSLNIPDKENNGIQSKNPADNSEVIICGLPEKEFNHIQVEYFMRSTVKDVYAFQKISELVITNGCSVGYIWHLYNRIATLNGVLEDSRAQYGDAIYEKMKEETARKLCRDGDYFLPAMPESMQPALLELLDTKRPREDSDIPFAPVGENKLKWANANTTNWYSPQDILDYIRNHPATPGVWRKKA
jgi:hypothetical protein